MPLSNPVRPPTKIFSQVGNVILQILNFIRPEIILGVFLLIAVLLAFLQITATGFYIVFGVFIVGYFSERIIKILHKKNV